MQKDERLTDGHEIQWISPSDIGYKDRKMAKWQGFILSDHADMIRQAERQKEILPKEKQSLERISFLAKEAYVSQKRVFIQLDFIENGQFSEDIEGFISGIDACMLYVQTKTDYIVTELECVRHIELDSSPKWYVPD